MDCEKNTDHLGGVMKFMALILIRINKRIVVCFYKINLLKKLIELIKLI